MNYRFLGRTGLRVSQLCLGAMTFGRENEATEEETRAIMDRFAEAGGNFIDTANIYSLGGSEEIVGRWLQEKNREDWVVATKVRFPMGEGPNDVGLGRKLSSRLQRQACDGFRRTTSTSFRFTAGIRLPLWKRLSQPWINSSKKALFATSARATTPAGSYSAQLISAANRDGTALFAFSHNTISCAAPPNGN